MRTRLVRRAGTLLAASLALMLAAGTAYAAPPNKTPTPVITSNPATYVNTQSATFTFTNTNTSAVFTCQLDGGAKSVCTSPKTYTGVAVGSHTFKVSAQAPGLKASGQTSKSWTVDLTAPNVPTVSQPASPTQNTTTNFTFSSSSSDIQSYLCSVDGAAEAACTSPKAVTVAQGAHTIAVKGVDHAGNVSAAKTIAWTVDTSTDAPVITSGPPSVVTSSSATFYFSGGEPDVTFTCAIDSTTTYTACTTPKTYTALSTGNHTVRVRATDAAGNVATSAPYSWKIDPAAPVVLGWSNQPGLPLAETNSTSGTFAFTATGQSTLACLLDGVDQGSCTSPKSVSSLADGPHTFAIVANAGLATEAQMHYTWNVDTVTPNAPTISGPTGVVGVDTAEVAVTAGSVDDALECELDSAVVGCSSLLSLSGLADGDHEVLATATDLAGNSASSSLDWTVDTSGPAVTVTAPASLTAAVTVDFDEDTTGVSADSLYLSTGTAELVPSTMSCVDDSLATVACGSNDVARVSLQPASAMVAGGYYSVNVNPVGFETVADTHGNLAASDTYDFRAATTVDDSSGALTYSWRKISTKNAKGGSYYLEHRKNAKASWSFSGRSVSWLAVTGPAFGKADVFVDGVRKATFNNYASRIKFGVPRTVKGLSSGKHTITVVALGHKGAKAGKGTFVGIDGFKVGKKVTSTPVLTNVAWGRILSGSASAGSYAATDQKGQTVKLTFRGTGVDFVTARCAGCGKAGVYVDGALVASVDNYAPGVSWNVTQSVSGLTDAEHTVVVKALGTKSANAKGALVILDHFEVQ